MSTITDGSHYKPLWECSQCGHQWHAEVANRCRRGSGCPVCGRKKNTEGKAKTDYLNNPLSAELRAELVTDEDLPASSHKVRAWRCKTCKNTWSATPANRSKGKGCPFCSGRQAIPGTTDAFTHRPDLLNQWSERNSSDYNTVTLSSGKKFEWCCEKGHTWTARMSDRTREDRPTNCPYCGAARTISVEEQSLFDYIKSICPDAQQSNRTIIGPKELDIYIPSKGIAVEYNGNYWHTDKYVSRDYHYDKWSTSRGVGIQMITIWSDEWLSRPELVKNMLRGKILGRKVIGGRKTKVVDVDLQLARQYLDENHIQGWTRGTHYTGLTHEGELVALMVTTVTGGVARLDRYCSSVGVMGGMDKMMKHLGYAEWVTFADHCVSDGGLYESSGWSNDGEVPPDYKYLSAGKRVHKFNFRRKRFRDDPNLLWNEGLTERQLAELNGLQRIYDCGKTRYRKSMIQ